jgi:hypothetical protein
MPETSPTESSSATDITESPVEPLPKSDAATPATKDPAPASLLSKLSGWTSIAALVIAVIAATVAIVGWFRPHNSTPEAPTYSDQQVKDAKMHVCTAFMTADRAVVRNTHLKNPPEGGPIGALSVATSARLALYGGGAYLRDRVALEPATPPNLAKPALALATTLEELGIGYLASAPEFTQDSLRQNLDAQIKATAEQCK